MTLSKASCNLQLQWPAACPCRMPCSKIKLRGATAPRKSVGYGVDNTCSSFTDGELHITTQPAQIHLLLSHQEIKLLFQSCCTSNIEPQIWSSNLDRILVTNYIPPGRRENVRQRRKTTYNAGRWEVKRWRGS